MKTLIGIDIQPDFITGALANKDAEAIIPDIVEFIKNWQGPVVFTRDTHVDGIYENSLEGKYLPADKGLKHCIHGTEGWMVRQDVANAAGAKVQAVIDKCILSQIVTQLLISNSLPKKKATNRCLVFPDQQVKRLTVMKHYHFSYKSKIIQFFHFSNS